MSQEQNKKTLRHFQCRDYLWEIFEQMSGELECSTDYLINEAMRQYARSRNYGTRTPSSSGTPRPSIPASAPTPAAPSPRMDSPQAGEIFESRDPLVRHLGTADAEHLKLGEQFELSQPGVGEFALREIEDSQVGHRGKSLQAVVADAAAANAQMLELGEFGNLRHARVGEFVLGVVELQGPQARHIC